MRIYLFLCWAAFGMPVLAQPLAASSPPAVVSSLFLGMPLDGSYGAVADYCRAHDFKGSGYKTYPALEDFRKEFVPDSGFAQQPDSVLLMVYLTSGSRPDSAGMMRMLGYNVMLIYRGSKWKKRADKEFAALRSQFRQALGDEMPSQHRDDYGTYRKWKVAAYWLDAGHKRAPVGIEYTIRNASPDKVEIMVNYTCALR